MFLGKTFYSHKLNQGGGVGVGGGGGGGGGGNPGDEQVSHPGGRNTFSCLLLLKLG